MPLFNVFYFTEGVANIKERDEDNRPVLEPDNQFIVLYDEQDGNFYYYGTRNRENQTSYIDYSGKFHYTRLSEFVQFIEILVDSFTSRITTELHQIQIDQDEYDILDFEYLKNELTSTTEMAAYDSKKESFNNMYNYLSSLVTHEW